jgi:gluconolactonase
MEGRVEIVATQIEGIRFQAPNDLAFGADGRLYFTDPGRFDMETRPDPGYIFALDPDGSGEVVAETGHTYPNGIVAEANGSVVWVESYTRAVQRWHQSHGVTEVCILEGETHLPDGLKVAANGDLYITTTGSGGLDVVAPDGSYVGFIPVGSVPTNCAFRGTTLYVTDGGQPGIGDASYQGILWAVEVPVQGVQPFRGAIS